MELILVHIQIPMIWTENAEICAKKGKVNIVENEALSSERKYIFL
jgi:hypothetical protein